MDSTNRNPPPSGMGKIKIEIAISCVWFQRRLCWMLSSLAQQVNPPDFSVSVGYLPNNGNPTTEQVCHFFNDNYFDVSQVICTPEEMPYRGLVRNRQLAASTADWMLFADTDMVYDSHFLENLAAQLSGPLATETRCISASRISLNKEECNKAVDGWDYSQMLIPNVAEVTSRIPVNAGRGRGVRKNGVTRNVGAGYFQLANIAMLRQKHGGLYWDPKGRRDPTWGYRSDRQFRHKLGGICPIETRPQYHLNHDRDGDGAVHLETQR